MSKSPVPPTVQNIGTFKNSAGEIYTIRGLSPVLPQKIMDSVKKEFEAKGKPLPVVPTYTAIILKGTPEESEEIREHTEKSILEGTSEEVKANKIAWAAYQAASEAINNEYNARIMRAVFMAVEAKPTQEWRDEMKFIGADTPKEGTPEERYNFIETHVIQAPADLAKLMTSVFRLAGIISEAAVAEVDATFQRFVEDAYTQAGKQANKAG
jgi:hypothetical protein